MTVVELKKKIIEGLGERYISESGGRVYVNFDAEDDLDFQILPNFTLGELITKNKVDTFTKLELGVLVELQAVREDFGHPVTVSSSYRSKAYNKSKKGATSSEHMLGHAIDSHPVDLRRIAQYKAVIRTRNIKGGVGEYKTFVHIDTGKKRRWRG